jgi:hypothetical protein
MKARNELPIDKLLDPKFYLENFTKIKGKVPGLIPFILNPAQLDLFNAIRMNPRVIILKARQIGFCLDKSTKVLSDNLRWITLEDIKPGQGIVSVEEFPSGGIGTGRKMIHAVVEQKCYVRADSYKIKLDNGVELIATAGHRFLQKVRGAKHTVWRTVQDTKLGDEIRFITGVWEDPSFEDGWFAGMLDGEGSLSKRSRTGATITISQVEGPVLDRLRQYVQSMGIVYREEWDRRLPGASSKFGGQPVCKIVIGRSNQVFCILGQMRPSRFVSRDWWSGRSCPAGGVSWSKVVSIEAAGEREMVDLQTSEKTYIANGFVSHNSTAITGYLYHKTITTPGTNTALIGYNSDLTAELLDKVKTFYKTTPDSLKPQIQYNSKYEISFPAIDSKIIVLPSSENVGRGYTLHNVLCTELAFWDKAEEKMLAIENAVPKNGRIIIESTPNAIGNLYHRMWMADNDYCKKKYGWWWHYSEEEIEAIKRRINNPMRFAQEYELEFLSSGRPVFSPDLIKRLRKGIYKIGDKVKDTKNELEVENIVIKTDDEVTVYFPPQSDRTYVVGADVAEGVTGGDYSVMTIFDRSSGEEVAFWRGYMAPERFGAFLGKWGRTYNTALVVVEVNNHGLTTVTALKNDQYPQIYFRPTIKMDTMGTQFSDRMGWKTTKVTRPLMIDDLREALGEGSLKIHSEKTIDEMLTFVFNDDGDMVAQSSFHDDCIFASAIGFQGFKIMYSGKLDQIDYESELPRSTSY